MVIKFKQIIPTSLSSHAPFLESLRGPIELFASNLFFANLLAGFELAHDSFVKSRFLYIVTIGIWTLSDAFSEETMREILTIILSKYLCVLARAEIKEEEEAEEVYQNILEDFQSVSASTPDIPFTPVWHKKKPLNQQQQPVLAADLQLSSQHPKDERSSSFDS